MDENNIKVSIEQSWRIPSEETRELDQWLKNIPHTFDLISDHSLIFLGPNAQENAIMFRLKSGL